MEKPELMCFSAVINCVVIGADVIGVNVVTSGDVGIAISQDHASLVKWQYIFVTVFASVFRSLSDRAGLVAAVGLNLVGKEG